MMTRRDAFAIWAVMLALFTPTLTGQTLTSAQLQTLKTNIAASSDTIVANTPDCGGFIGTAVNAVPNTSDGNQCLSRVYALPAAVDFWVWRTSVSRDEYVGSTSVDGTTFSWVGTGYITRSQGERDAFIALFNSSGFVNPSQANVRQAVGDIFSGATAPAPANRTHLLTVSRRKTSRFEKLYATGTGSTATPGLLVIEGAVTAQDINTARNLP